jgi:hypothetical protein
LLEFLGKEGLDFLLAEAEVERLDDKLLDGRAELAAAGIHAQGGCLMGDEGADAAPGLDETLALEVLVYLHYRERIDVKIRRELADGRERGAVGKLAGENALLNLLLELQVERDAAVGVEDEHGVVLQ